VLPFDDLSPQKDQEAFCESISEYIITKLTKFEEIKVIQGDSIFHYKNKEKGPQSIGKELDVDAVLHGSVRSSNNNLLVVAKLMNVSDGSVIWADEFTEPVGEALNIQSNIALQIAGHLKTELSTDERDSIEKKPTENMEAFELYQRGRYLWRKRDRGSVQKSVQFFEQAIGLDPDFALAYAGLADAYVSLTWGISLKEAKKIKEYALKALALDETLAEPHATLGLFKCDYEWDFEGAKQEFEQSIALNPGYATAHLWYGRYFIWIGELDKNITEVKLARELDPLSPSTNRSLAAAYFNTEQYDLGLEALNRVLEIDPNHIEVHYWFGVYYLGKKMYDEALEEFNKDYILDPINTEYWDQFICALKGDIDKAREWIEQIEEQADLEKESNSFFWTAQFWAVLNEPDKVFFYLNEAYEQHEFYLFALKTIPYLDDYRSDPRYKELLKKMNLE
jgi:adenylate cyclase